MVRVFPLQPLDHLLRLFRSSSRVQCVRDRPEQRWCLDARILGLLLEVGESLGQTPPRDDEARVLDMGPWIDWKLGDHLEGHLLGRVSAALSHVEKRHPGLAALGAQVEELAE